MADAVIDREINATMKALSIKPPWGFLIVIAEKDIENRSWRIGRNSRHGPYSSRDVANFSIELPCRVIIHQSKRLDERGTDWNRIHYLINGHNPAAWDVCYRRRFDLGALIGEVDIVDCVRDHPSPWAEPGFWHFVLANPVAYETPIPYRGQLGFFEVEL